MINKRDIYLALCGDHRLLFAQSKPTLAEGAYPKKQLELFKARAAEYLAQSAPVPRFSQFNEYFVSGDRAIYQKPYYEQRGRLLVFSVLAYETHESRYIENLCEAIWALLNTFSWCIPAHFLDKDEKQLPVEAYATQLDLFSCETAFALAETIALCSELLPQSLIRMVHSEVERRVLIPFESKKTFYRFEQMQNNWSAVCGGAIGGAALYLIEDNERLSGILHRCISCTDVYLSSFGLDGVCTEGVDYWNYGFAFYSFFSELLAAKTNNAINLLALPLAQNIARAGSLFYLGGKCTISFSDGCESGAYRVGLCSYLSKEVLGFNMPPLDAAADVLWDTCYRYCSGLRDFYYSATFDNIVDTSGLKWLEDAQWVIVKGDNIALAAKAGHNDENHNHNDCGSFIFAKNNIQLITDLGAGLYDAEYFGPKRYDYLVNRSRSHNVALINSSEQCAGKPYTSKNVSTLKNGLFCELSSCYEDAYLVSYTRAIQLLDERVQIQDEFIFQDKCDITEVFCSKSPIILSDECAIFEHESERAVLSFEQSFFNAQLVQEPYLNHHGVSQIAYFLHLTSKQKSDHIIFTATIA